MSRSEMPASQHRPYLLPSQTMLDLAKELQGASDILNEMTRAAAGVGDVETLEFALPFIQGIELRINSLRDILQIVVDEHRTEAQHGRA